MIDSLEAKERIERLVRDAEIALLPDAGHDLAEQSPLLLEFLQRKTCRSRTAFGVGGATPTALATTDRRRRGTDFPAAPASCLAVDLSAESLQEVTDPYPAEPSVRSPLGDPA